jgi:hypothetical protein
VIGYDDRDSKQYASKNITQSILVRNKRIDYRSPVFNCPYNLYFNALMHHVPIGSWMIFMDDDGKMKDETSLMRLSKVIQQN